VSFVPSASAIPNSTSKRVGIVQFGDLSQQPPLHITISNDISLNGFTHVGEVSFLSRLQKQNFPSTIKLIQQNRMNQDIMLPINILMYDNTLISGTMGNVSAPLDTHERKAFKSFLGVTAENPADSQLRCSLLFVSSSHRSIHTALPIGLKEDT
jgi:hypothetical protein